MTTRRALLGAGAVALLAGCGPPEEPEVSAREVLAEQLRAERVLLAAQLGLESDELSLVADTRERIERLTAALRSEGGTPGPAPTAPGAPGLETALEAAREVLRTHVRAVGLLESRPWRELQAGLIAGSAPYESAFLALLERPPSPTAFPGQPVA
jgi:hypothetical protein